MSLVISFHRLIAEATMEKLIKMFEDMMVAVTFAEAGEFDEANRIAGNEISQDEKSSAPAPASR
jgi:hypothetical protein